jgi:DNA mismatch repair protein MutL
MDESRRIAVLPELVVNQIAAGEVVERPASVVKELVDNALDAGATRIVVELEGGGIELVRVTDDGAGIGEDQLALAVAPHATSKIRATEDLDRIASMGFRGEALASIASVSRLSIRSRTAGVDHAVRLEMDGGASPAVRPDAGPVGTSVAVRTLFFNTPARRKFLKTPTTEQGHCVELVRTLALAHCGVGFRVEADGRVLLDVPAGQTARERAFAVLGRELEGEYLEVGADRFDDPRGVTLWGLAGTPALARPTTKRQFVFLNGRPIRDKTVQHALREAYRGLIEPSRHPAAVLMLEMSPEAVDVNVHPAKAEVRFRDQGLVHKTVYLAVRESLRRADLTPDAEVGGARGGGLRFEPAGANGAGSGGGGAAAVRERFVEYFQRYVPSNDGRGFDYEGMKAAIDQERAQVEAEAARVEEERRALAEVKPLEGDDGNRGDTPRLAPAPRPADRVLQVHNSFVVTQDEHGVVIVDQHALHERVMFEKLLDRVSSGPLERQRLLMPAVVETTAARAELVESLAPLLERLGIEAAPAGPSSVAVQAFPTFLFDRKVEAGPFVEELLEVAEANGWGEGERASEGARLEEALHEVLDLMACKAAVKAGDGMSQGELDELLAMKDRYERASNCPHGRPTSIRLSIRELERQFGRS